MGKHKVTKSQKSKSEAQKRSDDPLGSAFQSISRRRWDFIAERWRGYLPAELKDMPEAYQFPVDDEVLAERMREVRDSDRFEALQDAPIIRTLVFESARFCGDRSLYFTRIAERLAQEGRPTASLTAAYLAMMFGARGVQNFLGLYYCFSANRTWLIDIWPDASEVTSQGQMRDWTPFLKALVSDRRMGHEHHWKLLMRLKGITTRLPIEEGALAIFRRMKNHSDYSDSRNSIQYGDHWPCPDLYNAAIQPGFGVLPVTWRIYSDDPDVDIKLAQILAFCSASMLLEIIKPLPKFRVYAAGFKERLSPEWHPILGTGALSAALSRLCN
jgi:hypothetical protein